MVPSAFSVVCVEKNHSNYTHVCAFQGTGYTSPITIQVLKIYVQLRAWAIGCNVNHLLVLRSMAVGPYYPMVSSRSTHIISIIQHLRSRRLNSIAASSSCANRTSSFHDLYSIIPYIARSGSNSCSVIAFAHNCSSLPKATQTFQLK